MLDDRMLTGENLMGPAALELLIGEPEAARSRPREAHFGDPEGNARRALGEQAYERARSEGYSMSPDQAKAHTLEAALPTA
jgi:hypothetical protein